MRMNLEIWIKKATGYLAADTPPSWADWESDEDQLPGLFAPASCDSGTGTLRPEVEPEFYEWADLVLCHQDSHGAAILYQILWRLTHGEKNLLRIKTDDQMRRLELMHRAVMTDIHRMKGFVRFKKILLNETETYGAWYEPDHFIVPRVAGFFRSRFALMRWVIFTPRGCLFWDCHRLRFGPGLARDPGLRDDYDDLWQTYYKATFNPSRANPKLLRAHMPQRFWKNLPELRGFYSPV